MLTTSCVSSLLNARSSCLLLALLRSLAPSNYSIHHPISYLLATPSLNSGNEYCSVLGALLTANPRKYEGSYNILGETLTLK